MDEVKRKEHQALVEAGDLRLECWCHCYPQILLKSEIFGGRDIYIQFVAGITGISVAAIGVLLSAFFKYLFRARLKRHHQDIYRMMFPAGSIGWIGGKDVEKLIYDSQDSTLVRLYRTSKLAPLIGLIAFAVSVAAFIILSS